MEQRESQDAELWDEKATGILCWVQWVGGASPIQRRMVEGTRWSLMTCGTPGANFADKGDVDGGWHGR